MKPLVMLCLALFGAIAAADCKTYNISDPQLSDATNQCASILQGTVVSQQFTGTNWIVTCQYACTPVLNNGPTCSTYNISDPQLSDATNQCASILQGTVVSQQFTGTNWIVTCQYNCTY